MSELISGKEALVAIANGEYVEIKTDGGWKSTEECQIYQFLKGNWNYKFRLKPRTINLNGIEVPAPFKPKEGEQYYFPDVDGSMGYSYHTSINECYLIFGAWRTEEEIKQVVVALRTVFTGV